MRAVLCGGLLSVLPGEMKGAHGWRYPGADFSQRLFTQKAQSREDARKLNLAVVARFLSQVVRVPAPRN